MLYRYGSLEDLSAIDAKAPVFIDTETSKLGSQIRLIQVYQEGWDKVLLFDTTTTSVNIWVGLQPYILVGHNIHYDFGCFKKDMPIGCFEMPSMWEDTFYASRLAFPTWNTDGGYSLDNALTKILGYDPYKREGLIKKELQMSFERLKTKHGYIEGNEGLKELTDQQLVYASIDVYELPKLYHAVKHMFTHFVYELDKLTIEHIAKDTLGIPLDLDKLGGLEVADKSTVASNLKQLGDLNVNSYMQVRKALGTVLSSDEMALQIMQCRPGGLTGMWTKVKMTNGKWSKALTNGLDAGTILVEQREFGNATSISDSSHLPTSSKVLVYFNEVDYIHSDEVVEKANLIISTRKALKRLNFVARAKAAYVVDELGVPRISATFSPHAINGRIQQSDENLTQYPRTMKSMWGHTQGNGRKLIYCDFAQIELRIICAILPEMNMYKSLKEGVDLHTFVANNLNFTEAEIKMLPAGQSPRQVAKQANFLLLYGGGATNFQRVVCRNSGVWLSDDMSNNVVVKWKSIFSDIKKWHLANSRSIAKVDSTCCGRKYKADLVTDLNNIKVSGTGSEIFKLALHYIAIHILDKDDNMFMVNRVHDSVTIDVPDDLVTNKITARNVTLCFQKAWFEVTKLAALKDVPMPCDASIGSNMADIEGGKADESFALDPYYMMDKELKDEIQ